MNDIVTKRSDKVLVQNRPLQVVNKLLTMIKDVIFAVFFPIFAQIVRLCQCQNLLPIFGFTNRVILMLISGHDNESCLDKFRATTDMPSIAVRPCMLQLRKCGLLVLHQLLIMEESRQQTLNHLIAACERWMKSSCTIAARSVRQHKITVRELFNLLLLY